MVYFSQTLQYVTNGFNGSNGFNDSNVFKNSLDVKDFEEFKDYQAYKRFKATQRDYDCLIPGRYFEKRDEFTKKKSSNEYEDLQKYRLNEDYKDRKDYGEYLQEKNIAQEKENVKKYQNFYKDTEDFKNYKDEDTFVSRLRIRAAIEGVNSYQDPMELPAGYHREVDAEEKANWGQSFYDSILEKEADDLFDEILKDFDDETYASLNTLQMRAQMRELYVKQHKWMHKSMDKEERYMRELDDLKIRFLHDSLKFSIESEYSDEDLEKDIAKYYRISQENIDNTGPFTTDPLCREKFSEQNPTDNWEEEDREFLSRINRNDVNIAIILRTRR